MGKRVELTIGKDGSVRREVFGFKGESCFKATEWLDKIYGTPEKTVKKESYNLEEEVQTDNLTDSLPSGWCG